MTHATAAETHVVRHVTRKHDERTWREECARPDQESEQRHPERRLVPNAAQASERTAVPGERSSAGNRHGSDERGDPPCGAGPDAGSFSRTHAVFQESRRRHVLAPDAQHGVNEQ